MSSGHGIGVPGTVPNPNDVNQSGKPADALGPEDDEGEAAEQGSVPSVTTSDGSPNAGDEHAVEQPARRAHDEDDRDRDLDRHAGHEQQADDRARQAGHRLDRQVDLAGDDDQRHRQGHDRDLDHGRGEVREVAAR